MSDSKVVYSNMVTTDSNYQFILDEDGRLFLNLQQIIEGLISLAENEYSDDFVRCSLVLGIAQTYLEVGNEGYAACSIDQISTPADL